MARSRSIGSIYAELTVRDKMSAKLKRAEKSISRFASRYAKLSAVALGGGFAVFAKSAVSAASDLEETLSKSNRVFGQNAAALEMWASTTARALGQSKQASLEAAASFGNLFSAMGVDGRASADMSRRLVELASDLASFNNTSPEDAITALGAALRGESEPMRRYGVLLDDATLKAQALAQGIYSGKGALTPAAKALAAYNVILEQTKTAQGDFARTSDGLANSQRQLSAMFSDLTAQVGTGMLPAVQDLVSALERIDYESVGVRVASITRHFGDLAEALHRVAKLSPAYWLGRLSEGALNDFGKLTEADIERARKMAEDLANADPNYMKPRAERTDLPPTGNTLPPASNWFREDAARRGAMHRAAQEAAKALRQEVVKAVVEIPYMLKRPEHPIGGDGGGESASYESPAQSIVNEYQRRGLSLDPSGRNRTAESLFNTTESILTLLQKHFNIRRELRI